MNAAGRVGAMAIRAKFVPSADALPRYRGGIVLAIPDRELRRPPRPHML